MAEKARGTQRRQASEQQRLDILDAVALTAFRIHLEMIQERLEGLGSRAVDRGGTIEQHKRLSDAQRFLRGAATCLGLATCPSSGRRCLSAAGAGKRTGPPGVAGPITLDIHFPRNRENQC